MGDTTERIPEMHEDLFLMYSISRMGVAFECWEPKVVCNEVRIEKMKQKYGTEYAVYEGG